MVSPSGQQHVSRSPVEVPTGRFSRWLTSSRAVLPGVLISIGAVVLAILINGLLPTVSPLLTAIVLGAALSNLVTVPPNLRPGLQFTAKRLLRIGVALLGLQLVIGEVLSLGIGMIGVIVAIVCLGIAGTMLVGRLLGMPWTQRILIACGFSICGAAAVAAVNGVIDSKDEEEVVTAVALVVIFGTLMIPAVPAVSAVLGLPSTEAGLWAGGSIHEVAQVVAAAGAIGGSALGVAVVVKLARVLMLAPLMAVLSVRQRRIAGTAAGMKRPPLVPLFVLAFMAFVAVRSTGAVPDVVLDAAGIAQTGLLTAAMFALGTGVHVSVFRKVGARPFILATASTAWIAAIALVGVLLTR